ncbi:MAG: hypothetical protein AB4041_10040 [Microcystaceae cyanobacterium]
MKKDTTLDDTRVNFFETFLLGRKKYYATLKNLGRYYWITLPSSWLQLTYPYFLAYPGAIYTPYGYRLSYFNLNLELYLRCMEILFGDDKGESRFSPW